MVKKGAAGWDGDETAPSAVAAAMERNLVEHVCYVQERAPGMTVERRDGVLLVDSGLATDTFNKVLAARLSSAEADESIARTLKWVRGTGRPFTWWVGPGSQPADLGERLEKHGLVQHEQELGMVLDLDRMPRDVSRPDGVEIQRVANGPQLADFARVLAELSDPPDDEIRRFFDVAGELLWTPGCPMRLFIAYVDSEPAAVSELFIGGGVAGVHMVATATAFRRRGLGMALTWQALAEGRKTGLKLGTLQATDEGRPVYERLGFVPCGRFVEYGGFS